MHQTSLCVSDWDLVQTEGALLHVDDRNDDSRTAMHMAAEAAKLDDECDVCAHEHIITAHIRLPPQFPARTLYAYDDGPNTAEHDWCDV